PPECAQGPFRSAPGPREERPRCAHLAFFGVSTRPVKSPKSSRQQDANLTWRLEVLAQIIWPKQLASSGILQKVSTRVALASWRVELLRALVIPAAGRSCGRRSPSRSAAT